MKREELQKIFEDVKANHASLRDCEGPHNFSVLDTYPSGLPRDYKCSKCGGTLRSTDALRYQEGLLHAYLDVMNMMKGSPIELYLKDQIKKNSQKYGNLAERKSG